MSADNGIYILKCKDQSRVIHAQAIDNLNWSFLTFESSPELVPTRIVEYFGDHSGMPEKEAREIAFNMEQDILNSDFPILEYGINTISIDKTWEEIVKEAKELAPKETESLEDFKYLNPHDSRWDYELEVLNKIGELK